MLNMDALNAALDNTAQDDTVADDLEYTELEDADEEFEPDDVVELRKDQVHGADGRFIGNGQAEFTAWHDAHPTHDAPVADQHYFGAKTAYKLNAALRAQREADPHLQRITSQIDQEMATSPYHVEEGQQLYRGVGEDFARTLTPGRIFSEPGYASTTTMRSVALQERNGEGAMVPIHIRMAAGTRVLSNPTEAEILLPRNTTFKVTHVEEDGLGGISRIHAEVHPPHTPLHKDFPLPGT